MRVAGPPGGRGHGGRAGVPWRLRGCSAKRVEASLLPSKEQYVATESNHVLLFRRRARASPGPGLRTPDRRGRPRPDPLTPRPEPQDRTGEVDPETRTPRPDRRGRTRNPGPNPKNQTDLLLSINRNGGTREVFLIPVGLNQILLMVFPTGGSSNMVVY